MKRKAAVLINVGSPLSPEKSDVAKYLREFLGDGRVIDLPWLFRKILVNMIIVPFRKSKSSKLYKRIWNENGSPLLFHTENLRKKLEDILSDYDVFSAMRYGSPSLAKLIRSGLLARYDEIVFVPLFPHYASSTSGTAMELIYSELSRLNVVPNVRVINQFYSEKGFIESFAEKIEAFDLQSYDFIVFTYHSLPISHIDRVHPEVQEKSCNCREVFPQETPYCYKATCYETTRLLVERLGIDKSKTNTAFQSRLTKNWLEPFTDDVIVEYAKLGKKRGLLIAASFVADCLETIIELEQDYAELFKKNGGEQLDMVPSLNDSDTFAAFLADIIRKGS